MEEQPRVGVGVMVLKDGKVLLGKRLSSHGAGEYSFPGGKLEHLESIEDCAKRETREEAGIEIQNVRFLCVTNSAPYPPKHFINVGVIADWKSGEPLVMEPEKLNDWQWYEMHDLPRPLFEAIPNFFHAYKGGDIFYDMRIHGDPN